MNAFIPILYSEYFYCVQHTKFTFTHMIVWLLLPKLGAITRKQSNVRHIDWLNGMQHSFFFDLQHIFSREGILKIFKSFESQWIIGIFLNHWDFWIICSRLSLSHFFLPFNQSLNGAFIQIAHVLNEFVNQKRRQFYYVDSMFWLSVHNFH